MNRRRINPRLRIQFLGLLMLLGCGSLGLRLWWVQVARGAEWTARIRGSSEATVRIPSVRGEIKDRNGLTLVQNRASYEVDFYLPEMVKGYRERFGQPPLTEYRATINGMPKDQKEPDIVKIVNDGVVPRLDDLDLARDYNAGQLQRHFRNDTEVPFSYIKDIDFPTMAKFSEHDVGLPGCRHRHQTGPFLRLWRARRAPPRLRRRARRHEQGRSEKVHLLSGRRGREIEHRKVDGRLSARKTRRAVSATQRQGHDRRRSAGGAAASKGPMLS